MGDPDPADCAARDLRTLRVRILVPNRKRTLEVNVTGRTISRTEAAFKARQDSEGRLVIGLVLTREGRSAAGDKVFTFDLVPDLTPPEVDALVDALNRCVTDLGMAVPGSQDTDREGS
jgi:hypothetical protein